MGSLLVACKSDTTGPEGGDPDPVPTAADSVAGSFVLASVDGKPLPVTILAESGYELHVTAGQSVLQSGGAFSIALTTREVVLGFASVYVDSVVGAWTQTGTSVQVTVPPEPAPLPVGWDGTRLTFTLEIATTTGNYAFVRELPAGGPHGSRSPDSPTVRAVPPRLRAVVARR